MKVVEIVISKSLKRNLGNYESEDHFASMKASVESNDDVATVTRALQDAVDAAIANADPRPATAPPASTSNANAPPAAPDVHVKQRVRVLASGGRPADPNNAKLKELGFAWDSTVRAWWIEVDADAAQDIVAKVRALGFTPSSKLI
ncbi:MAG: hypothetical protein ACYDCK_01530 [Thermoplasmatota archaeon]